MEGEKDDIQFYFGRAFRALKRAENDMTRKIVDTVRLFGNLTNYLDDNLLSTLLVDVSRPQSSRDNIHTKNYKLAWSNFTDETDNP